MLGMPAQGAPGVPAAPAFQEAGTQELVLEELVPEEFLPGALPDPEMFPDDSNAGTQELKLPGEASSTDELGDEDLNPVFHEDPYEDLGVGLPPLEGEPTQARPGPSEKRNPALKPRAASITGLPKTAKAPQPPAKPMEHTNALQPQVAFPSEGLSGLPPLDAEKTRARGEPSDPFADRRASDPFGPPGAARHPAPPVAAPPRPAASAPSPGPAPQPAPQPAPRPAPGPAPQSTPVIPPTTAQPTAAPTPGKLSGAFQNLRQRVGSGNGAVPVALAGVPILILVLGFVGFRWYQASEAEEEIAAATLQATNDGLVTSLATAIERDREEASDAPEALARRARLYATAAFEHGDPEAAPYAQRLLDSLEESTPDSQVAAVYLGLEAGQTEQAVGTAVNIDPTALQGEAGFATAMAALAQGDLGAAERSAMAAQTQRAAAPRYVALVARILGESGESDRALQTLDAITEPNPSAVLARGMILLAQSRAPAAREALAALDGPPLAQVISERQRTWGQLLQAEAALATGDTAAAQPLAQAALNGAGRPEHDLPFGLRLGRVLLDAGLPTEAKDLFEALPAATNLIGPRAILAVEIHLALRHPEEAQAYLEGAGDSLELAYPRGLLAEQREQNEDAERAYAAAEALDEVFVRARLGRARLALAANRESDAVELLNAVRTREPANVEMVSLLVEAYLGGDNSNGAEARSVVTAALAAAGDNPPAPLRLARAKVELAWGQVGEARRILEELVAENPRSADLQASLGDATLQGNDFDAAKTAYEAALGLDPRHRRALLGAVEVELGRYEAEPANQALERARRAELSGAEMRLLRARLALLRGEGQAAISALGRIRRRRIPTPIALTLGGAQVQAEKFRDAERTFARIVRRESNNLEAQLGLAAARIGQGDTRNAVEPLQRAEALAGDAPAPLAARVAALRGHFQYARGDLSGAQQSVTTALEKDDQCADAHYLQGLLDVERGRDPIPALRRAAAGRQTPPAALGEFVLNLDRGEELCAAAERYRRAAPRGQLRGDVAALSSRCR